MKTGPALAPRVEVRRDGGVDGAWTYALLDQRQREVADEVRTTGAPGALLLSEVAPVITVGRRSPSTDLTLSRPELSQLGIEVLETDRGGLATYHGPGQWVLFAVDRLERLTGDSRGVRRAVDGLLEIARSVAKSFGVPAEVRSGCELGVWNPVSGGKLAAVGVHIDQRVLLHGLALNLYPTPTSFRGLRPCGLDAPVDFLLKSADPDAFSEAGYRLEKAALSRFWPLHRHA